MLNPADILDTLDNSCKEPYNNFITLEHPYVYLIDSRLNIFRGDGDRWAVAAEVLGYNPRGSSISLEIFYFGNCLVNLESYQDRPTNTVLFCPIDFEYFQDIVDDEVIKPDVTEWIVRGVAIPISHRKKDYEDAGIELKEYEPDEISVEEAGRLAIINHGYLFRATDEELYKSIPADLEKILVLDEWYHKDFYQETSPFDSPMRSGMFDLSNEFMQNVMREQKERTAAANLEEWENNRPGSYETWQQLARVIATGDVSLYQPTLPPNSHWINWPESGAL